jgi:hypothetical protein
MSIDIATPCWWDRIEPEDGGIMWPDGDISIDDIPADKWQEHRSKHGEAKDRYRLADDPCMVFVAAGEIMIGYPPKSGSE